MRNSSLPSVGKPPMVVVTVQGAPHFEDGMGRLSGQKRHVTYATQDSDSRRVLYCNYSRVPRMLYGPTYPSHSLRSERLGA